MEVVRKWRYARESQSLSSNRTHWTCRDGKLQQARGRKMNLLTRSKCWLLIFVLLPNNSFAQAVANEGSRLVESLTGPGWRLIGPRKLGSPF